MIKEDYHVIDSLPINIDSVRIVQAVSSITPSSEPELSGRRENSKTYGILNGSGITGLCPEDAEPENLSDLELPDIPLPAQKSGLSAALEYLFRRER